MTDLPAPPSPLGHRGPLARHLLAGAIVLFCLALIGVIGAENHTLGTAGDLVDFDAFYVVGLLIHEGRLPEAYRLQSLVAAYREFAGADGFMPWTYPPTFDLVVAALPLLPRGLAYAAFTGGSFLAYVWVLHRLAGPRLAPVLGATLPVLLIQIACGQNGFMTGALVGWLCLAIRDGHRPGTAGVPLGLMAIKPHLGLALGLWALARGRWDVAGTAVAVGLAFGLAATLAFGPGSWADLRAGVAEAAIYLARGDYPLFRMTSLYAALHRLGMDPGLALAAQALLAIAACAAVVIAARRTMAAHHALALACAATLMISPYTYDYDLTILGVALALIARDLGAAARGMELALMAALLWVAGGWGLLRSLMNHGQGRDIAVEVYQTAPSVGAPLLLAVMALAALILARAPTAAAH